MNDSEYDFLMYILQSIHIFNPKELCFGPLLAIDTSNNAILACTCEICRAQISSTRKETLRLPSRETMQSQDPLAPRPISSTLPPTTPLTAYPLEPQNTYKSHIPHHHASNREPHLPFATLIKSLALLCRHQHLPQVVNLPNRWNDGSQSYI